MSAGATFDRVYREIKRRLAGAVFPPGERIEPAHLAGELHASITPVRDALHRLSGERLVESPEHNGFRMPLLTEAALRDLYAWRGLLLTLAVGQLPKGARSGADDPTEDGADDRIWDAAPLFLELANATGSPEHCAAIAALGDRLAPFRQAEADVLENIADEAAGIAAILRAGERRELRQALVRYHRRRVRMTPQILARLHGQR